MSNCEYVREHYKVPAKIGRIVNINGETGVIAEDRGHYIGVNFDHHKAGFISNCHPTWEAEYLGIGKIRSLTRSQRRYKRFLEYGDGFESFLDFCRWDAEVNSQN